MASKRPAILSVFVRRCICSFPVPRAAPQIWPVRQKMPQTDSLPPWAFATFCKGLQPIVEGIASPCGNRGWIFSGHASPSGRFRPVFPLYTHHGHVRGTNHPAAFMVFLFCLNAGFKFFVTSHLNILPPKFSTSFNARFNFSTTAYGFSLISPLRTTQRGNGHSLRSPWPDAHTHRRHSSGGYSGP